MSGLAPCAAQRPADASAAASAGAAPCVGRAARGRPRAPRRRPASTASATSSSATVVGTRPRPAPRGESPSRRAPSSRATARSRVGGDGRPLPRAPRRRRTGSARVVERSADDLGEAVAQRAELEEVEQPPDLVGVDGAGQPSVVEADLDRRRRARSTISSALLRAVASCSARFWRSFGVCSSTWAKIPSRPP